MSSNETSRGLRCIFKQSLNFLALGVCLGSFTGVLCASDAQDVKPPPSGQKATPDPKSEEARKILEMASEKRTNIKSLSADLFELGNENGEKAQKFFELNNPDGTQDRRTETLSLKDGVIKKKSVFIRNNEGSWYLVGKTAIRMDFQENFIKEALKKANSNPTKNNKGEESRFELLEGIWDGNNCYVITETNKNENLIYKVVYYIGKKNYFFYREEEYSSKGELISSESYKNVQFNIPLDPNLFVIPSEYKIVRVEKREDLPGVLARAFHE